MTDSDLDLVYTRLCHALSSLPKEDCEPALARFALLAMLEINDPERIKAVIERAILPPSPNQASTL